MMKNVLAISFLLIISAFVKAQKTAPLWEEFIQAKASGRTPVLPDFSYAGYHFSEKELPSLSKKKQVNVTDYGALPNDDESDEEGIQAAINAAEKFKDGG